MTEQDASKGFAVLCDSTDCVEHVLQNNFDFVWELEAGGLLTGIFDGENIDKALRFLEEAREKGSAFNWELIVRLKGGLSTLHCAAVQVQGWLVVIGAHTPDSALQIINDIIKINNEQSSSLRLIMKDLQMVSEQLREREQATYQELTGLNSRMAAMQRELLKKNHELAQLNEQKNYFLGVASHDLRSPLHAICGYSELLYKKKKSLFSAEELKKLEIIKTSSEFMLGLINDLLDVSHMDSGRFFIRRSSIDVRQLLTSCFEFNRIEAEKKQIEIILELSEELPATVEWDPVRMRQVMNNLVSNAIKFSHPESSIRITVSVDVGNVVIAVQDSGIGMGQEELEQLFVPFNTAGRFGTLGEKSTGLGLTIARRVVEEHGGKIEVTSRERTGTCFTLSLPAA